ncbi:neutral zinc metallopeptidase [Aestuariimicrobium sp. p3-SID1156]|uniref:KPN_02809 family neutral zinc metallopeptidase n=1 Tax=Aestuariimicrobium sp. p3-SID1156 TaxID=2916038 RepID=UPI00223BBAB3|nr:neutral zinc metallopeptidase [Aestuariimicrobium sp. p3-SID1156]MCT1458832.1 neutral zinc metallopeptidase [Aestuariimicrobium sp. p3-SID1156]
MDFKSDAGIDSGSVISGGGGGRGGGLAVGGIGGVIIAIIAALLGFNPADVLGGGGGAQGPGAQQTQCRTGADVERDPECRWPAYMTSLNQYWSQTVNGYQKPTMRTFSGSVQTACGTASSQVGPFYCPGDQKIYVDTRFVGQLLQQLGTESSSAAEAYIVGHEFGHHIQNLTGVLAKSQDGKTGPTSNGVRVELQADCYAGVWFKWAAQNPDDIIENITQDDLNRIVDAARAVGDDHIQQQSGGGVHPDGWTHGSSKMRKYWLAKGFNSGDPNTCDTFSTDELGQ